MSNGARYRQFLTSADELELAARLTEIVRQMRIANVIVGITGAGHRLFVAIGPDGRRTDRQTARDGLIPAGCLAKVLTATLVAKAVAEARLDWHDDVSKTLDASRITATVLAGVTVQQLLNHTHGLDASSVKHVPKSIDGRIDAPGLCEALGARRLSRSGDLYSYSDAGAWLAGAMLETIYAKRYSELLADNGLLRDRNRALADGGDVCPATGASLRLAAWEWLEFLETHALRIGIPAARRVPLPGWCLFEQGVCDGWKSYAGGWLGHNSNDSAGSAVLRFHPQEHIGIIAAAQEEGAAMLALAGLLGQVFPDLFTFRMPRPLATPDGVELQLHRYLGDYSRTDTKLEIAAGRRGTLCMAIHDLYAGLSTPGRELRVGRDEVFLPEVRDDPEFPFVQFVRPDAAGIFEYVWNGKQLWRRE